VIGIHPPRTSPARDRVAARRRTASWGSKLALASLALLHLPLLVERIGDGSILEPLVLLRWLATAATIAVAARLHSAGIVPWRGRAGVVLALVVLLLHAGGAPVSIDVEALALLPAELLFGSVALLGLVFALLATFATTTPRPVAVARGAHLTPASRPGFRRLFASRPPPAGR
jgi:hypothetical protein